ncbi:MAG: hypothetical protein NT094_04940 [Candidatus Staskawiczbacteria bacterium]|nr:hypothetical protein [Candidatus Staskawiczbacteria bacterium]
MEEKPKTYIDKGFIDLADDVAFRTIKDGCNCFGYNYKGYQKAVSPHPHESDTVVWFPKIIVDGVWDNSIFGDGKIIIERCMDDKLRAEHVENCLNDERIKRVVFVREKDSFGELMYIFKGLFELDRNKSNFKDGVFWNRIGTRVRTYKPI